MFRLYCFAFIVLPYILLSLFICIGENVPELVKHPIRWSILPNFYLGFGSSLKDEDVSFSVLEDEDFEVLIYKRSVKKNRTSDSNL